MRHINSEHVIVVFLLYEDDLILCQGGFEVSQDESAISFNTINGNRLEFIHSYCGTTCSLVVSFESGLDEHSLKLVVPINRTKKKWKRASLGLTHDLFYRSVFENHA